MADTRTPTHILYGMPGSLYTGKVRSYLRKQGIDFEERTAGDPRFLAEAVPAVGRWIIPVLQTPQGQWVQDGADIIDHLESAGLARQSAYPATPVHHAVALVLSLFGGEGLLRPAMHYRWNFDEHNLAFLQDDFGSALCAPGSNAEHYAALFERSSSRMRAAARSFGVTADTQTLVESSYRDFLQRFNAHLADSPYLLGSHATLADFGLIGPLYAHLARDPFPATLTKQLAPRVWRWVERMNAPEQGAGAYALQDDARRGDALFAGDAIPPTLQSLLRFVAEDYLPELRAHVAFANDWLAARPDIAAGTNGLDKPGARSIGMAGFDWRGAALQTAVMPYRFYLLQKIQDSVASLPPDQRSAVRAALAKVGLAELLDLRTLRRVERRGHLEVWGAAAAAGPAPR